MIWHSIFHTIPLRLKNQERGIRLFLDVVWWAVLAVVILWIVLYVRNVFFRKTVHAATIFTIKLVGSLIAALFVFSGLYFFVNLILVWTSIAPPSERWAYRNLVGNTAKMLSIFVWQSVAAWVAVVLFAPMALSHWVMRISNIAQTRMEVVQDDLFSEVNAAQ